jgi:hypothetical protein
MQSEKRRVLVTAVICLCIAGSGGVVGTTHGHATHEQRSTTNATHDAIRVEFVNDSTVVVHGTAEIVGVGTAWTAPDGAATSYFEYGPLNGTTRIAVPRQGTGTTITYVTVYDDAHATPVLTRQHAATRETTNATTTSDCRISSSA